MTPDTGILTYLLKTFLTTFKLGFGPVNADATTLLAILATIEVMIALLFWILKGEDALVGLIQKILVVGVFTFFVAQWPALVEITASGFQETGSKAGGQASAGLALTNPSAIIDFGFVVTQPIQDKIDSLSSGTGALMNAGQIMMYGWAMIGILIAFFVLAIQAFITYLEFYLVSVLALILIPFGVFKHTSFLAEKAFGVVIAHGVKLMVLTFIMTIATPLLSQLVMPADPSIKMAWCMLLAAGAILFLAWHAPAVAGGMMAGGPSLNAGTAAGTAVAAGAGLLAAGIGGAWAASRAGSGISTTVKAAGALQTGAQMGALDTALAGGGRTAQAVGAASGTARVIGSAVAAPARSIGDRMSQKLREGNLKGYDLSRGTDFSSSAGGASPRGDRQLANPAGAVKWAKSVIPADAHPQGGISAPIRPDDSGGTRS